MKKATISSIIAFILILTCVCSAFADNGQSINDVIADRESENTVLDEKVTLEDVVTENTENAENTENVDNIENTETVTPVENVEPVTPVEDTTVNNSASKFIDDMNKTSNLLEPDIEATEGINSYVKTVAAWIVQVLSYVIVAFLSVGIIIDLAYIALPFTRVYLANGYVGQAQRSTSNSMMTNQRPYGSYGMNNGLYGGQMQAQGNMYNGQMAAQNAVTNRNSSIVGNVQLVSNAALNAVSSESVVQADGKTDSPYKYYFKHMTVTLIIVPVLILLSATGVLTQLGFAIGDLLMRVITGISGKIGNLM